MHLINVVLLAVLITSAATDGLHGKIYNVMTYPAVLVGVLLNSFLDSGVGLQASLAGFTVGFVPFFALFLMGLMHGGDVKLLGAICALKGYPFILHAIFLSFLVAGFLALAKVVWRGQVLRTFRQVYRTLFSIVVPGLVIEHPRGNETIPFGVAALVGSVWALVLVDGLFSFSVQP